MWQCLRHVLGSSGNFRQLQNLGIFFSTFEYLLVGYCELFSCAGMCSSAFQLAQACTRNFRQFWAIAIISLATSGIFFSVPSGIYWQVVVDWFPVLNWVVAGSQTTVYWLTNSSGLVQCLDWVAKTKCLRPLFFSQYGLKTHTQRNQSHLFVLWTVLLQHIYVSQTIPTPQHGSELHIAAAH